MNVDLNLLASTLRCWNSPKMFEDRVLENIFGEKSVLEKNFFKWNKNRQRQLQKFFIHVNLSAIFAIQYFPKHSWQNWARLILKKTWYLIVLINLIFKLEIITPNSQSSVLNEITCKICSTLPTILKDAYHK